jgi:hypothetical protein
VFQRSAVADVTPRKGLRFLLSAGQVAAGQPQVPNPDSHGDGVARDTVAGGARRVPAPLHLIREASMSVLSLEQQARQKARIATRLLADAQRLYEETGRAYDRPGLNAEALAQLVEELTHRIAEADRLAPLR